MRSHCVAIVLLPALCAAATAQSLFEFPGTRGTLVAGASGKGVQVLVSSSGSILVSSNSVHWFERSIATNALAGVAFGAGQFVAVAEDGHTEVSVNGWDWSMASSIALPSKAVAVTGIAFSPNAGGLFGAVDTAGRVHTSPNAGKWTLVYSTASDESFAGIAAGAGLFAAVGTDLDDDFDTRSVIRVSNGAAAWNRERYSKNEAFYGVAWAGNEFLAVGQYEGSTQTSSRLVTSANGTSWALRTVAGEAQLNSAAFGEGFYWVFGEDGTLLRSANGTTGWKAAPYPGDDYSSYRGGLTDDSGRLTLFGDHLLVHGAAGAPWVDLTELALPDFLAVAYGNGRYVGLSSDTIWVSTDRARWFPARIPVLELELPGVELFEFRGLAFGDGKFLAVGTAFDHDEPTSLAATSTDGLTWTVVHALPKESLQAAVYAKNAFYAVGSFSKSGVSHPRMLSGASGSPLLPMELPASPKTSRTTLTAVAASPTAILAIGDGGSIYYSTDGARWTDRSVDDEDLVAACFASGEFRVVDALGSLRRSTDGIGWQMDPDPLEEVPSSLIPGAARIVATGGMGIVFTSDTGLEWSRIQTPAAGDLMSGVYTSEGFLVAGAEGTLVTSKDGLAWSRLFGFEPPKPAKLSVAVQAGILNVQIEGTAGTTADLQYSADLGPGALWNSWRRVGLTGPTIVLEDLPLPSTNRYLRVISSPGLPRNARNHAAPATTDRSRSRRGAD